MTDDYKKIDMIGHLETLQLDLQDDVLLPLLHRHFHDEIAYEFKRRRDWNDVTNAMYDRIYDLAYKEIVDTANWYAEEIIDEWKVERYG